MRDEAGLDRPTISQLPHFILHFKTKQSPSANDVNRAARVPMTVRVESSGARPNIHTSFISNLFKNWFLDLKPI